MIYIHMQYFGGRGSGSSKSGGGGGYQHINDDSVLDEQVEAWRDSLIQSEADAVSRYSGGAYSDWNNDLRNDDLENSYYKDATAHLDSALSKFTLDRNITTYRGIDADAVSALTGIGVSYDNPEGAVRIINSNLKGAIIADKGYLSTSISTKVAYDFAYSYMLRVHTPKGKGRGAYIKSLSNFKGEKEFLMPRGTHLKVQKASYDPQTRTCIIDVKYVK